MPCLAWPVLFFDFQCSLFSPASYDVSQCGVVLVANWLLCPCPLSRSPSRDYYSARSISFHGNQFSTLYEAARLLSSSYGMLSQRGRALDGGHRPPQERGFLIAIAGHALMLRTPYFVYDIRSPGRGKRPMLRWQTENKRLLLGCLSVSACAAKAS